MPVTRRVLLHRDGPALWPEHKPLPEVLRLRDTTPEVIWYSTYQCVEVAPGGALFEREWYAGGQFRFDPTNPTYARQSIGRYLSFDTAQKDRTTSDYTAYSTFDLMPDYRLFLRRVFQRKLTFPNLIDTIESAAREHNYDGKLKAVLIEDKNSGTSAYQTLTGATADPWLAGLVIPFTPTGSKGQRAGQAAVWSKNGSVWLPHPAPEVQPWLSEFEEQLFTFSPVESENAHDDMVDCFSQLVIYLENYLSAGYHARVAHAEHEARRVEIGMGV